MDNDEFQASKEAGENAKGIVSETIKKLFTAGVSAAFLTEESIRAYLKEVKLPREVLGSLLQGANKSKEELMNVVTNEVVNVIKKIDVVEEASRFVEEHKFKISAEIEVVRKGEPRTAKGAAGGADGGARAGGGVETAKASAASESAEINTNVRMNVDPFGKPKD